MDTGILYRKGTRYLLIPFAAAFCVILVLVVFLYAGYFRRLDVVFGDDSSRQLSELSAQSVRLVEERLQANLMLLDQISSVFYSSERLFSDTIFDYLKKKTPSIGAIRLDLTLPDGSAVAASRDGTLVTGFNLGRRDYFQRSMRGEQAVEFLHESVVDHQEVFVCSVPVRQEEGVVGVLSGVYDLSSLEQLLCLGGSQDDDFSFLVASDGSILTGRSRPELSSFGNNFYAALTRENFGTDFSPEEFRADIASGASGITAMVVGGSLYHAAYSPVASAGCYLVTMIPSVVLTRVSKEFMRLTVVLAVVETAFILLLGGFFALVYRKNRHDLYDLAFKDSVTGGGNNMWFRYEVEKMMRKTTDGAYALVMLDIDNLKLLNDTYGYDAGNRVLEYVYNFVTSILVSGEIAARAMQDDFVLYLRYCSNDVLRERLEMLADKLNSHNLATLGTDDKYVISLTAGVYMIEDMTLDMLSMQDRAYMALNCAKRMRGSLMRCAFFQEQDRIRLHEEKRVENRMEEALENGEFVVYLQPKYDISTNTINGAEALVRWMDPERGMVPPDRFIPLFERNGFIFKVDLYVFEQICRMLRSELDRGLEPHTVSVNLSRAYLTRPNFLEEFKAVCTRYDIPPKYLELELTETIIFENMDLLIQVIGDMHAFGFTCSLDDFGSGYSSLNILKSVPVDVLKLDKEFFADPEKTTARGTSVIESVIELAQKLKMKTVSEGVEKEWQVDLLRRAKCDMVQGFIYSRPVPISDYEALAFKGREIV